LNENKVAVIGGGTAGFLAAQAAAQHGARVTVIEKEKVGGICPNWGCIPMCFMDHCADVIERQTDMVSAPEKLRLIIPD